MKASKKNRWIYISFALISVAFMIIPTVFPEQLGILRYNDGPFQFSRIESLSNIWQAPTNFHFFQHYGNAVNLCYPWLTIYPAYLLYRLTHHIIVAYSIYMGILTFITLSLCYETGKKMQLRPFVAVTYAILYSCSFYRIYNFYYRFALGEAVAMTFLPLLLYGLYQLFVKKERTAWYTLTLAMTLTAYTHLLSLMMYSLLLLVFFLVVACYRQVNRFVVINFIKVGVGSVLCSVGALLPLVWILKTHSLYTPLKGEVATRALSLSDLWTQSLRFKFAPTTYTCGITFLILLILVLFFWRRYRWWEKATYITGLIFFALVTKYIPWHTLQNTPLAQIQFPWRFFTLVTLLLAYVGAQALAQLCQKKSWLYIGSAGFVLAHCIILYQYMVDNKVFAFHSEAKVQKIITGRKKNTPWRGSGRLDYVLEETAQHKKDLYKRRVYVNGKQKKVERKNHRSTTSFYFDETKKSRVVVPVGAYSYITAYLDGEKISYKKAENGGVTVSLPQGKHRLTLKASYPKWMYLTAAWSVLSAGGLFVLYRKEQKAEKRIKE